jgi:hypothetical protein
MDEFINLDELVDIGKAWVAENKEKTKTKKQYRTLYDRLVAVYSDPYEIILYVHPKDPGGNELTDRWTSIRKMSDLEFIGLIESNSLIKLSENHGDGLSAADRCYFFREEIVPVYTTTEILKNFRNKYNDSEDIELREVSKAISEILPLIDESRKAISLFEEFLKSLRKIK